MLGLVLGGSWLLPLDPTPAATFLQPLNSILLEMGLGCSTTLAYCKLTTFEAHTFLACYLALSLLSSSTIRLTIFHADEGALAPTTMSTILLSFSGRAAFENLYICGRCLFGEGTRGRFGRKGRSMQVWRRGG